ncbi:PHD finger-like domain-containing protein 5A isoform X1 [Phacochoerus africanus]|uniref:PHD finger-like domain-containing protein 5A isoform X1 n=1 Tax=Phacochoerus africanus TaxID=41426 RepID=UPI001FD9BEB4|nr:PHD finger-like domain-containing protein 5A isoform X1 [Phacochoerus africanus]
MAKHHPDLIFCRKQAGVAIGRLCEKCDGKCVICDSYVRPCTLVRICDECNYGSYQGRCVICGGPGVSDAYYCKECTIQEKDLIGASPGCLSKPGDSCNTPYRPFGGMCLVDEKQLSNLYIWILSTFNKWDMSYQIKLFFLHH